MILDHIVVALVDNQVKKVECLTCHSQHAYRDKLPKSSSNDGSAKDSSSSKKKGTAKKKERSSRSIQNNEEKLYLQHLEGKDVSLATPYSMRGSFEIETIINHKKFGPGIVIEYIPPKKIRVLFRDGYKYLVCGQSK
ncbi:MAG: hypothetical protein ACMUIP_02895 [bacterium]